MISNIMHKYILTKRTLRNFTQNFQSNHINSTNANAIRQLIKSRKTSKIKVLCMANTHGQVRKTRWSTMEKKIGQKKKFAFKKFGIEV